MKKRSAVLFLIIAGLFLTATAFAEENTHWGYTDKEGNIAVIALMYKIGEKTWNLKKPGASCRKNWRKTDPAEGC